MSRRRTRAACVRRFCLTWRRGSESHHGDLQGLCWCLCCLWTQIGIINILNWVQFYSSLAPSLAGSTLSIGALILAFDRKYLPCKCLPFPFCSIAPKAREHVQNAKLRLLNDHFEAFPWNISVSPFSLLDCFGTFLFLPVQYNLHQYNLTWPNQT